MAFLTKNKLFTTYRWSIRFISAVILFQTLFFKFSASPESVYIFTKTGMEPWGRILTGIIELIASIALMYNPYAWLGAFLATVIMFGAIFSHITLLGIEVFGDHGELFFMACGIFIGCIQTLYFERSKIPIIGSLLTTEKINAAKNKLNLRSIRLGFLFLGVCFSIALIGIFQQIFTIGKILEISSKGNVQAHTIAQLAYFLTILGVLAAFLLSVYLLKIIGTPIIRLIDVCKLTEEGSKSARVQIDSDPVAELGVMAISFNSMLDEIQRKDDNMNSLLAGIPDAVFFFDKDGHLSKEKSRSTENIFPFLHHCSNIFEFFNLTTGLDLQTAKESIDLFWDKTHNLDFETIADMLPKIVKVKISEGNTLIIHIKYRKEITINKELTRIIVVATDKTIEELHAFENKVQTERVKRISNVGSSIQDYLAAENDSRSLFIDVQRILKLGEEPSPDEFTILKRNLHSLKGMLATFHFTDLSKAIHDLESNLDFVFVDNDSITSTLQQVQNLTLDFEEKHKELENIFALDQEKHWVKIGKSKFENLKILSNELPLGIRTKILALEHQRPEILLKKFASYLANLSEQDGTKSIKLLVTPESDEIHPQVLLKLASSLGHIFRNSFDHGIETMEDRIKGGKSETGTITFNVQKQDGTKINISIKDDGKGIQSERLVEKAIQSGLWTKEKAAIASDSDKIHLIFEAGLSIKDQVSETSGRGVGMDAVKAEIENLGGSITVQTKLNIGTEFIIFLN